MKEIISQDTLKDLNELLLKAKQDNLMNLSFPKELLQGDPKLKMEYLQNLGIKTEDAKKFFQELDRQMDKEALQEQQAQIQKARLDGKLANSKTFNLKKAQEIEGFEIETNKDNNEQFNFRSIVDLVKFLDSTDESNARYLILENVSKEREELVASILKNYYERDWSIMDDIETKKILMTKPIWDSLAPSTKSEEAQPGVIETATYEKISSFVEDVNSSLKKIAQNESKSFNLKKFAQAKTVENVIMWGPQEKRFDPFLRQPVSDWHIVERNKGFGIVVDDVWNIDWEAIWRGNIMDKYSRPYRDSKTGEWIGGYIQKRFEVDKWIPKDNNYQLKPGELRKPYIPSQKGMEARLTDMREKQAKEKNFQPVSEGKPYDWNKEPQYSNTKVAFNLSKKKVV